jgi:hypothetical protein
MAKNTKKDLKSGMGRSTSNWIKRVQLKFTSSKTRRAADKEEVKQALEEINPSGMCQTCGGNCATDTTWCGCVEDFN